MGYIAIVTDERGVAPDVRRCHINVWRFNGLLVSRSFYFDIGLGVAVDAGTPTCFRLALPLSADGKPFDLRPSMRNEGVCALIFGRVVRVEGDALAYKERDGADVSLRLVSADSIKLDPTKSGSGYSLWEVRLPAVPEAQELYIRYRFHVADFSRAWMTKGSRELINLRVADTREGRAIAAWSSFDHQIVPIAGLRVFVIVPTSLEEKKASPAGETRLYEGEVWRPYLRRRWQSRATFSILNFKPERPKAGADDRVGSSNPFRLFVKLARAPTHQSAWSYAAVAASAALGTLLAHNLTSVWTAIVSLWSQYAAALTISAVAGGLWNARPLLQKLGAVGQYVRAAERWLFDDR
jgi:hypothetical protein